MHRQAAESNPASTHGSALDNLMNRMATSFRSSDQQEIVRRLSDALAPAEPIPPNDLLFVHRLFRPDKATMAAIATSSTAQPPAMFKDYPAAPRVPLGDDFADIDYTLTDVLWARAARRDFVDRAVPLRSLSTLLGLSCGIKKYIRAYNTGAFPVRMAPSGGGLQPWEVYLAVNNIEGLAQGLYHYNAPRHSLSQLDRGQVRHKIAEIGLGAEFLHFAACVCIITCVPSRFQWKYGIRGYRTAHIDVGILIQNMWLLATGLKLRAVPISGFSDADAEALLRLDSTEEFTMIMFAVGARPEAATATDTFA